MRFTRAGYAELHAVDDQEDSISLDRKVDTYLSPRPRKSAVGLVVTIAPWLLSAILLVLLGLQDSRLTKRDCFLETSAYCTLKISSVFGPGVNYHLTDNYW